MYIETSFHQKGDSAILISPKLPFSGKMCLQFYYHMYGAGMGTLNVFLKRARVFTACGDKGDKWLKAAIDVDLSGMYAVRDYILIIMTALFVQYNWAIVINGL